MIGNKRIRRALAVAAVGCLGFLGLFDMNCFGEPDLSELFGGTSDYYDSGWGYDSGGYDGGDGYNYSGIGGGIGSDGETFYFIDGDSSYISGP